MILLEVAVGFAAVFFGSDFGRAAAGGGGRAGAFGTAGLGLINPFVVFDSLLTAAFTRRSRT